MAVVYRARDQRLGRLVALNILVPTLTADLMLRRRFIAGSRAAAVDDPHIISMYEAGEAGGVLFIAVRFVPGGYLRRVLEREGALAPGLAVEFVCGVYVEDLDLNPDDEHARVLGKADTVRTVLLDDLGVALLKLYLAWSGYTSGPAVSRQHQRPGRAAVLRRGAWPRDEVLRRRRRRDPRRTPQTRDPAPMTGPGLVRVPSKGRRIGLPRSSPLSRCCSPGSRSASCRRRLPLRQLLGPDHRVQGHAVRGAARAVLPRPVRSPGTARRWSWCAPGSQPARSRPGRWPIRT
jgi:hypothetical protein